MAIYSVDVLSPAPTRAAAAEYAQDLAARVAAVPVTVAAAETRDVRWDVLPGTVALIRLRFDAPDDQTGLAVTEGLRNQTGTTGGIEVTHLRVGRGKSFRVLATSAIPRPTPGSAATIL